MTDEIDYKSLFEQVQKENETIRIQYIKLKNEELSFFDKIKGKWSNIVDDPMFPLYLNLAVAILVLVVVPLIRDLFAFFIKRRKPDVE